VRKALGRQGIHLRQFFLETVIVVEIMVRRVLLSYGFCALVDLLPMPPFLDGLIASWKLAPSREFAWLHCLVSALYRRIKPHPWIDRALRFEAGG